MSSPSRLDLVDPILALPRPIKRLLVLATDIALCVLTVWIAFYLRLDQWVRMYDDPFWRGDWAAAIAALIAIPLFITHGFYRVIFRHANLIALSMVLRAFAIYWVLYAGIITVIGVPGIPRTVGVIQPLLLMVGVGLSRGLAHYWLGGAYRRIWRRASLPKALIYGAGEAGRQLSLAMVSNPQLRVIGFLDDDKSLHGQVINGHKVYDPQTLEDLAISHRVSTVLLALPSVSRHRRHEILAMIKEAKVGVRTLPSVTDLAQGRVTVSDLRELEIEDLLGRDPVAPERSLLEKNIRNKVVMVTGAGGSIGSELCRQIAELEPKQLVLFEQSEYALYQIEAELARRLEPNGTELTPVLGSVQDELQLTDVMRRFSAQTVYHAAAYKHVPLVEHNPTEGIKNNVFGTLTAAQAAIAAGVEDFVLISTDKAVRPTNVMGASKRLAEMVLQALAAQNSQTRLTMVRFGNVLGSSGSVVPKFRQQIQDGGPVTLTDPEVTRYFMTLSEAAELVIQAGAMAQSGDVFVLDMGEPIKIIDLARRMIELSGLSVKDEQHPEGDILIATTGLRPGEKLYEELLIGENPQPTSHRRIMRASEEFVAWPELKPRLEELRTVLQTRDANRIKASLKTLVTGYHPYEPT